MHMQNEVSHDDRRFRQVLLPSARSQSYRGDQTSNTPRLLRLTAPIGPDLQDIFTYLDIIVYVEATIYQMDEDNEKLCGQGGQEDKHILTGKVRTVISTSNLQLGHTNSSCHRLAPKQVKRRF